MFGHIRKWFGAKPPQERAAEDWYKEIMAKAREPELFVSGAVDDTLEGRFAMVSLVSTLVLRALRDVGPEGRTLAEEVYKQVFSGFDYALREEGVGDSSIARKMRKMGEEFFGLARAIDSVLSGETEDRLSDVLLRNGVANKGHEEVLARWAEDQVGGLAALSAEELLSAQVGWRRVA